MSSSAIETLVLCKSVLKKLILDSVNENRIVNIYEKIDLWIGSSEHFECDLLQTIADNVLLPDEYFYASSEFGGTSEVKIGANGYMIILIILYCRYLSLVHKKQANVRELNNGLKLNLRRVPVTRIVLDVDIDNSTCTERMAKECLNFIIWTLMHFVESNSRILVTRNMDVVETQSFHIITETQYDVISYEIIRNYMQEQMSTGAKIDVVNNWTFPNGRFHYPDAVYTCSDIHMSKSFNDNRYHIKCTPMPGAGEFLTLEQWLLMAPVNILNIDSTFSLLEQVARAPESHFYCIINSRSSANYLTNSHLTERVHEPISALVAEHKVKIFKYIKFFSTAHRIEIPRQKYKNNQLVVDSFFVHLSSLRLLFSTHRRQTLNRIFVAGRHPDNQKTMDEVRLQDNSIPYEFYEILLFTNFSFRENKSIADVFTEAPRTVDERTLSHNIMDMSEPDHSTESKILKFFQQKFTFTFHQKDIQLLAHCFDVPNLLDVVNNVCNSLWKKLHHESPSTPIFFKALYIRHCAENSLPLFITESEYSDLCTVFESKGFTLQLDKSLIFGGRLPSRSAIGALWDDLGDYSVRILLHCLMIAIGRYHFFDTLSFVAGCRIWKVDIVRNSMIFLLNIFDKSMFLSDRSHNTSSLNVDSTTALLTEAPVQMLFTFVKYLQDVGENLLSTVLNTFRFNFLVRMMFDHECAGDEEIMQKLLASIEFKKKRNTDSMQANGSGGAGGGDDSLHDKKKRKKIKGTSQFHAIYELILETGDIEFVKFIVHHVVPMYRREFFTYIYVNDRYVVDSHMPEQIKSIIPAVKDTESKEFNYWYRREMGIYNSYYGTFEAHSPSLYSGVYIESPNFLIDTTVFNMFDYHLKNRIFNILMKGVHFAEILNYQHTALVLCGTIYPPSKISDEVDCVGEKFRFEVSSLQVVREDLKSDLPYPPSLIANLYKTQQLRYLYLWYYLIVCEMSQAFTIEISQPSKYVFPCQDPNSEMYDASDPNSASQDKQRPQHDANDAVINYTTVEREFCADSEILKSILYFVFSKSSASASNNDETMPPEVVYLHKMVPSRMQRCRDDEFSPYTTIKSSTIFNVDDLWIETMNMFPSPDLMDMADIDETIRNHIISVGGPEFELFILLLISWHIRTLHSNEFSNTAYMSYIKKYRKELYGELTSLVATTIGPFFTSNGHESLVGYFKNFTSCTRLEVDPLTFHLSPPPGYLVPCNDQNYIGETPAPIDKYIHEGVIAFLVQCQFNKETILDLLKLVTKCTRPINRERLSMALLNRPRTGKNGFIDLLTQSVFKTNHQNSFRYHELVNSESENVGNKLYEALNQNLLVSFDEVSTLPNVFKVICNNGCISGRPLFTDGYCSLWINAHPVLCSNMDPVCKECAVVDRVRVFDRFYQFTSLNADILFPRRNAFHDISIPEINNVFAVQSLLQTLPKENTNIGEYGIYILIWQMATLFVNTQPEPCTQRFTSQMEKTMTRFFNATDPAKYIISHKIIPEYDNPITVLAFKSSVQVIIAQDKTIPRSTNFNLNSIIHDILDRLQSYIYTSEGIEFINAKIVS